MKTLELAVRQPLDIVAGDKTHRVEFTLPAVAEIEKELGRSMKRLGDWFRIETKEVPAILRCGIVGDPAVAEAIATEICAALDPESIDVLIDALCGAAFPKGVERINAELQRMAAKGEQLPNAQSGAAS